MYDNLITRLPLNCPFCDEPAEIERGAKRIITENKIYYPRTCPYGHTFYSVELVPTNYGKFLDEVEQVIAYKDQERKRKQSEKQKANWAKRKEQDAKERKEKGLPKKDYKNVTYIKRAGQKDYYKKRSERTTKRRLATKEKHRKERRDEYLKRPMFSDID